MDKYIVRITCHAPFSNSKIETEIFTSLPAALQKAKKSAIEFGMYSDNKWFDDLPENIPLKSWTSGSRHRLVEIERVY